LIGGLEVKPYEVDLDTLSSQKLTAFQEGYKFGLDLAQFSGHCPHTHEDFSLRKAWMNRFAKSRLKVRRA
jgi:hypothetical protein